MIPEVWQAKRIGDLFRIEQGKSVTPKGRLGKSPQPFLRTSNVFWGRIDLQNVDKMDFSEEEMRELALTPGDLLVCEGGDIGRAAIWRGEIENCAFQNHLHRLRPINGETFPLFYVYWLQAGFTQMGFYEGVGNKTTIANLSRGRLSQMDVPQPPLLEQKKIAAILWKIQRAVNVETQLVRNARDLKKATMRQLFTAGLRADSQKLTAYGEVPESWGIEPLSSCAYVQTGATKGREIPDGDALEVPYLRVANVQDGHLDLNEMKTIRIRKNELDGLLLRRDDVVLTEGGDFDKLGRGFIWEGQIEPCVHQNHIFAVRVDREKLLPRYFAYLAQSPYGRAYFLSVAHKTTNLACINTTKLRAFPVLIPELDEQKEISNILETIDRKISLHETKKRALDDLFKTMLHKLMTAQIRVNDLDMDTREVEA